MKRGFTLLELLIVIGILAVLASVVTVVINPANLLKEARDIERINDLKTVKTAIDLYIARSTSINLDSTQSGLCDNLNYSAFPGDGGLWYASVTNIPGSNGLPNGRQPFRYPMTSGNAPAPGIVPEATLRNVDGNGWIPVNLLSTPGGPGISKLPTDPSPDPNFNLYAVAPAQTGRYYAYRCEGFKYEINANMESLKYSNGGQKDIESKDGGTEACSGTQTVVASRCTQTKALDIYEIGNDPGLNL